MEIKIKNLKKYYGERQILNIEEMFIERGKITGITGSNGCGKTTLLGIISGLDKEYNGIVTYNGIKLNKQIINNMTIAFQKPYLFRRTVYENIEYPLKVRGGDKKENKNLVMDIIKRLEIEDLINKKAHLLSGGESQKVALARALVFKPKLLLLDEPTSNIDPAAIEVLEREIIRFNKETNSTIVIVTHNMDQSKRLGQKIIEM